MIKCEHHSPIHDEGEVKSRPPRGGTITSFIYERVEGVCATQKEAGIQVQPVSPLHTKPDVCQFCNVTEIVSCSPADSDVGGMSEEEGWGRIKVVNANQFSLERSSMLISN